MRHISQDSHEEYNLHTPISLFAPDLAGLLRLFSRVLTLIASILPFFVLVLQNRLKAGRKRAEEIPLITLLFAPSLHAC